METDYILFKGSPRAQGRRQSPWVGRNEAGQARQIEQLQGEYTPSRYKGGSILYH